ncbi:MFS transporter [Streptomyces sp. NPDC003032]
MSDTSLATQPLLPRSRLRAIVGALVLAALLAAMDMMVVNVAMYSIIKDLDPLHGVDDSRWVLTVYTLALGAATPLYGKLADRLGGKSVMFVSLGLFLAGSLLCGIAQSMPQLIVFRGLQGLGAGGLMTVAMVIVAQIAPPKDRAKFGGYVGGVTLLGIVIGPVIGGFFADTHVILGLTVTWRWAFLINVPLTVLVAAALALSPKVPVERRTSRIDFTGGGLIVLAVCAVLLVTEWGGSRYSWTSLPVIGTGAAALVLLAAFVRQESRAGDPILPLALFRNKVFRITVPISLLGGFALLGMAFYMALYLRIVRGLDSLDTCLHLLPMILGMLLGMLITGSLVSRFGRYRPFPLIGSALAAVTIGLCATLTTTTSTWLLSIYLVGFGLGIGQLTQVPTAAVQNTVDFSEVGTASTAVAFARMMGQSLGPAIFGSVVAAAFTSQLPAAAQGAAADDGNINVTGLLALSPALRSEALGAFLDALHSAFLLGAGTLALAFTCALFFPEPKVHDETDTAPAAAVRAPSAG